MNEAVANYSEAVNSLAYRYVGWNGAEHDDLVQEGLIAVWMSIHKGFDPSRQVIEGRMKNWAKFLGSQLPTEYNDMLPLDLFEDEYHQLESLAE